MVKLPQTCGAHADTPGVAVGDGDGVGVDVAVGVGVEVGGGVGVGTIVRQKSHSVGKVLVPLQ